MTFGIGEKTKLKALPYIFILAIVCFAGCATVPEQMSSRPSMLPDTGTSVIANSVMYAMFGHLGNITDAKAHWARRYGKPEGSVPTTAEVGQFIKGGFPTPPIPGKYILNPVGQSPEFRMPFDQFLPFFRAREKEIREGAEPSIAH
jgi:hypothetical protein